MAPSNFAPPPNRRLRFPIGTSARFDYLFCAPPASPAAVGEARRSPKVLSVSVQRLMVTML